jgi:transcription elongation factor Elf1
MKPNNLLCGSCGKNNATEYFELIEVYAWCDDCLKHWLSRCSGTDRDYIRRKSRVKFITFEEYLVADVMQT